MRFLLLAWPLALFLGCTGYFHQDAIDSGETSFVRSFQIRGIDDPWQPQVQFGFSMDQSIIHKGKKVEGVSQCRLSGSGVDTGWKPCQSPVDLELWSQITMVKNQSYDFEVRLWLPSKEKEIQLGSTAVGKNLRPGSLTGQVFTVAEDNAGNFFLGGNFIYSDGLPRRGIHAQDLNGETLKDYRSLEFGFGEATLSMIKWVPAQEKFYVGGTFTSYNGQAIPSGLVRLNKDLTLDSSFAIPSAGFTSSGVARPVKAIHLYSDNRVLALGEFTSVGGISRNCIVLLEPNGSMVDPQPPGMGAGFDLSCDLRDVTTVTIGSTPNLLMAGLFDRFNGFNASGLIAVLPANFSIQSWGLISGSVNTVYPMDGPLLMVGGQFTANASHPVTTNLAVFEARLNTTMIQKKFGAFSSDAVGFNRPVRSITGFSVGSNIGYAVSGNFDNFDIQSPPAGLETRPGLMFIRNDGFPFATANANVGSGCHAASGSKLSTVAPKVVADSSRGLLWFSQNCTRYNGQKVPLGVIPIDLKGSDIGKVAPELIHVDPLKILPPLDFALADDKMVSVGAFNGVAGENIYASGILKLDPSGKPVIPENPDARLAFSENQNVRSIQPLPDGRLLVGGGIWEYGANQDSPDYLALLNSDLSLSQTTPSWENLDALVRGISKDPDGGYLVYGEFTDILGTAGPDPRGLFRLNPDLSLDHTFNSSLGVGLWGSQQALRINKIVVEPGTGTYWIAGLFDGISGWGGGSCVRLCTLRLNSSTGVVNFVNNSIGLGPATSAGSSESINDIVRLPNGQWLVTGNFNSWDSSGPPDSPSEFLYRLQANGSLDNTFAPRFNVVPLAVQYWPAVGQSMAVGNFGLARSSAGSLSSAQSIAFLDGSTGYLAANPLNGSYEAQTLIRGSFVDSKGRLWIYGDFGVHLNHQRQVAIEVFETNGKRLQQFPRFSSEN